MEVVNKKLINGAIYSGEIKGNIPHGKGIYETNNVRYEGYFKNGLFHGLATLIDKDKNCKFIGEFKNGNRSGFGRILFDDGKYFEGMFTDNRVDSYGYMEYADGEVYIGEFKNNLADGKGTVYYTNGNIYTGEFSEDKEDGIGVMMEKGNRSFGIKAEYKKDGPTFIHGQVKLTTEINVHMVYRMVETSEYRYFGMVDKYSNFIQGIYHYDKNEVFDTFVGTINGDFKTGVVYLKSGSKYEGFYENDKLTGKGTLTIFGKGEYTGEFVDGKKVGEFVFVDYNGNKYIHIYDNDTLVSTKEAVQ